MADDASYFLARFIRNRRETLGIRSDADLAKKAGIANHQLKTINQGSEPRASILLPLASALKVPVEELVYAAAGRPHPPRLGTNEEGELASDEIRERVTIAARVAAETARDKELTPTPEQYGEMVRLMFDLLRD